MAQVHLIITDEDGGNLSVECRSSEVDDHDSLANTVATYFADNWAVLVHSAKFAKGMAIVREAVSLEREKAITTRGGILDESGKVMQ